MVPKIAADSRHGYWDTVMHFVWACVGNEIEAIGYKCDDTINQTRGGACCNSDQDSIDVVSERACASRVCVYVLVRAYIPLS